MESELNVNDDPGVDILLIGLGNLLLGDEGVGIHVLRRLERDYRLEQAVTLIDGGPGAGVGLGHVPLFLLLDVGDVLV